MNKTSKAAILASQEGPSKRTLKRKLDEMCDLPQTSKPKLCDSVSSLTTNSAVENEREKVQILSVAKLGVIEDIGFKVVCGVNNQEPTEIRTHSISDTCIEDFNLINSIFDKIDAPDTLQHALTLWSLRYNIKNKALTDLLKILKKNNNPELPSDARTLKNTPRKITSREVYPGRYWHFGIKRMLELLKSKGVSLPSDLSLNVNIDGLPLYKSSKGVFWPILGKFAELPNLKPFVIGIYFHVSKKPDNLSLYLQDFVNEMKFFVTNRFCEAKIWPGLFIMDAPAMAFVKQTVGHNGTKACGKCEVVGVKVGRMCFPKIKNNKKRTDSGFRHRLDKKHHKDPPVCVAEIEDPQHEDTDNEDDENVDNDDVDIENFEDDNAENVDEEPDVILDYVKGPLEEIEGVHMIDSFAIDSLHVVYLGAVKKQLLMNNGKLKFPINELLRRKLKKADDNKIYLSLCSAQMSKPHEFHRAIRSMEYLSFFKGSELRNFLLYHGIVAFMEHVDKDILNNFLTLHCAMTICSSNRFRKYIPVSERLFEDFVKEFKTIYGKCMLSHNIHQLLHISEYVTKFGPLDNYSAFQFESKLGVIGNLISSGNHPLEQAANRIVEHLELDIDDFIEMEKGNKSSEPIVEHDSIQFKDFIIKNNSGDRWFLSKSKDIVCFDEIKFSKEGEFEKIIGRRIIAKTDLYVKPIKSSFFDIYKSSGELEKDFSNWTLADIDYKLFYIQDLYNNKVFFPILHTSSDYNDIQL